MKRKYLAPELERRDFERDVILDSPVTGDDYGNDPYGELLKLLPDLME